jgi:hypothetical protein
MKKILLFTTILLGVNASIHAAPGDTTWVQANQVNLDYWNNFDKEVAFPKDNSKTYRKILMIFTLGQYNCAPGTQYCHQWDYTVRNFIMTRGGDTLELNRFITPYANSGWTRFGSSWKQPYIFEVTNYAPLLFDTATVRIKYEGYSGGFTADVKFAFIEGTPDRDLAGYQGVYDLSAVYGNGGNPINPKFATKTITSPANSKTATLQHIITGHGSDDNGCCEFDNHKYKVNMNSTQIAEQAVWRDNCGVNELYPQGGTWIYNRANWCPGASVLPLNHNLPNIVAGTNFDLNIQFENYVGSGSYGNYTSSAIVFFHKDFNKQIDASIEDVIAPTNDPNYYRSNPAGSIPRILVHNSGKNTITSIDFKYGIKDSTVHTYTWNGTINALENLEISLPALQEFINMSLASATGDFMFNVEIVKVNNQTDEDATNNKFTTKFKVAPLWDNDLILSLKTGNLVEENGNLYLGNPNQKWVITDMDGNVVLSRENTVAETQYNDTIGLPAAGMYKLTLTSDNNMGLHWWPYDNQSQIKAGSFVLKKLNGTKINMKNYAYTGTARDDWGSNYSTYFSVAGTGQYTGLHKASNVVKLTVYPNPAQSILNIELDETSNQLLEIQLINTLGQTIYTTTSSSNLTQVNTSNLANGLYTLVVKTNTEILSVKKVIINK